MITAALTALAALALIVTAVAIQHMVDGGSWRDWWRGER